jgi:hypothetical protein
VVIVGLISVELMTMLRGFVSFPAVFVALTEKFDVPAAVGVPVIVPLLEFRLKPAGRIPLEILHVIGVEPEAASIWL